MNEKFQKLSQKIAQISKKEMDNPYKSSKLETKVENLEESYKISVDTLEIKYTTLKEHLNKLKLSLEEERNDKDDIKKFYFNEMKTLESQLKGQMNEERDYMKNFIENVYNKLQSSFLNIEKNAKKENQEIRNNILTLKEYVEVDIPALKSKLQNESEVRDKAMDGLLEEMNAQFNNINLIIEKERKANEEDHLDFSDAIKKVSIKIRDEFNTETNAREKFEENILRLLDETTNQLAKIN